MGALSGLASALAAARASTAMPPAPAPAPAFNLFGPAAGATPLPAFLRGLVGASDAVCGLELVDVVGGSDDPDEGMPQSWRELCRHARDPRVAEAFAAARALHAWMHEHPLQRPVRRRGR